MQRISLLTGMLWVTAAPVAGQQPTPPVIDGPWWLRVLAFLASLPLTLYRVFVDGEQLHLLPAPLIAIALCLWSFLEWRRQRYWTPRLVHIMAVLALATIVAINVDWVMAGGEMWTQRYVVIAIFGLFPYVTYLLFLGPRHLGRKRAPGQGQDEEMFGAEAAWPEGAGVHARPSPRRVRPALVFGLVLAGVVVVGAGAVAFTVGPDGLGLGPDYEGLEDPQSLVRLAHGVGRGEPGADVTITVFADYQCPACGTFANRYLPELEEAYIATGQARIVYYDLPLTSLHPNAFLAARATHCAEEQGAFWVYHDALFKQQERWSPMPDPAPAFEEYARAVGVNGDQFGECLRSERHAAIVEANDALGAALGIYSTPTILIQADGAKTRRAPAYTFRAVARTIEKVVASASR